MAGYGTSTTKRKRRPETIVTRLAGLSRPAHDAGNPVDCNFCAVGDVPRGVEHARAGPRGLLGCARRWLESRTDGSEIILSRSGGQSRMTPCAASAHACSADGHVCELFDDEDPGTGVGAVTPPNKEAPP